MNKRITLLMCGWLLLSILPISTVTAETVEDTPTTESTLPSMSDDLLAEKQNTPRTPSLQEAPEMEPEPAVTEEPPVSEKPKDESTESGKEIKPFGGGGIGPQTMNLIEGRPGDPTPYDIDADFAHRLRVLNPSWSGASKPVDGITDDDMANLKEVKVREGGGYPFSKLDSIKGIEYAVNITLLECQGNNLEGHLDLTQNKKLTEIKCANNKLESVDVSQCSELLDLRCDNNQIEDIDVSLNSKLNIMDCGRNPITSLNVSENLELWSLMCSSSQLTTLDVNNNKKLEYLECRQNSKLTSLSVTGATILTLLNCESSALPALDVSQNTKLKTLTCSNNQLSSLVLDNASELETLACSNNQLKNLDITNNPKLINAQCNNNDLESLLTNGATNLEQLVCYSNKLTSLDVNGNKKLKYLQCHKNLLTSLSIDQLTGLLRLFCYENELSELNLGQNTSLDYLYCYSNKLTNLDVTALTSIRYLNCSLNMLKTIDVSQNLELENLDFSYNQIRDITSAYGLSRLTTLNGNGQEIRIPVPAVTASNQATIDILRTTAKLGLSATNSWNAIQPPPTFSYDGDEITLSNVTRESLSEKAISFSYNGSQLSEGASSGTKSFAGTIYFYTVSDLNSTITPIPQKVETGGTVHWRWTITSLMTKKAESIVPKLTLPANLTLVPNSISINSVGTSDNALDGTTILDDLNQNEQHEISFQTKAVGDADDWLILEGRLDWADDTENSPHYNITEGSIQIRDEEQTFTPQAGKGMALISAPIHFDYGIKKISNTMATYTLDNSDYQSNTNVVDEGFYVRLKDENPTSNGWNLTAQLSNFKDQKNNNPMPNGAGASVSFSNMKIESIINRDTPQEGIDLSPTGIPSMVETSKTITAGQSAQKLISAGVGEGRGTWQLRIPFDKVSLNLPAGAGLPSHTYKAKVTWSLNLTP